MTAAPRYGSADAQSFNWLLNRFATETPGIIEAIAVSSDGLPMAVSAALDQSSADRLAAIACAFMSLAGGASRSYDLGEPIKTIIDFERGYMLVSTISSGSALGVLAAKSANLGNIAYEMAQFTNRAGAVLTPLLVEELKNIVGL